MPSGGVLIDVYYRGVLLDSSLFSTFMSQDGYWDGAAWVDAGSNLLADECQGHVAGIRIEEMPLEFTWGTVQITIQASLSSAQLPCLFEVWGRGNSQAAVYSTSNPPPLLSQRTNTSDFLLGSRTLSTEGIQEFQIELDATALDACRFGRAPAGGNIEWNGSLNLHIHAFTADCTDVTIYDLESLAGPTFAATLYTGEQGIEIPWGQFPNSRPDACPICGDVSLREEWGYCPRHRRLECMRCIDPEDVPNQSGGNFRLVGED